jgi:CheY-like chemotaxis protein
VTVTVRASGGRAEVEISDTGAGMAPEVLARAFEPFFTTKGVGQGSGLGLSIARGAVEAAGGQVELQSEPGRGTTVRCTLPLVAEEAPRAAPRPEGAAVPGRDGAAARPALRRRVLVLDDELLVRRSIARMLAREHDVTAVGSGAEALERLAGGERYDAILCDLMMPELDGVAVYQALRNRWPEQLSRLAFITGGAFSDRAERFLAEHPVRLLQKPLDGQALRGLVTDLAGG